MMAKLVPKFDWSIEVMTKFSAEASITKAKGVSSIGIVKVMNPSELKLQELILFNIFFSRSLRERLIKDHFNTNGD